MKDDKYLCVGLFGTCGGSTWREPFIRRYKESGIAYFNPQVEDWTPELAVVEAQHLANDAIILFPVTKETYGFGSLAETGFSMLQAMRLDDRRDFVIYIAQEIAETDPKGQRLNDLLNEDGTLNPASRAKESLRARALVNQHLANLRLPNVYVVSSLQEMEEVSVVLWKSIYARWGLQKYNPHNQ